VYATCLFCNRALGGNAVIEHFPVGARLAYDAAKGRLWVVCRQCERWNLTPIEERWEAIEDCERLFERSRLRVATDNVGLAKVADGTTLIRIGAPLRPEFAAWRYGDQFGRRRRRQMTIAGAGIVGLGALVAGSVSVGVGIGGFAWVMARAATAILKGNPGTRVATLPRGVGDPLVVLRGHLSETSLGAEGSDTLMIDVRHRGGRTRLVGGEAQRAAALLMPHVNRFGGSAAEVGTAVRELEDVGGSEAFLARIARAAHVTTRPPKKAPRRWSWGTDIPKAGLFGLPQPQRIALEMALHEESERRALGGELAELEQHWRQAEEIAAIADTL
jgi:hypothetical protein